MIHASRWLDVDVICLSEVLEESRTILLPHLALLHFTLPLLSTFRLLAIDQLASTARHLRHYSFHWHQKISHGGAMGDTTVPRLLHGSTSFSAFRTVEASRQGIL